MAFKFSWGDFDPRVIATARGELTRALHKGKKPSAIAADSAVKELNLGTTVTPARARAVGQGRKGSLSA